MDIDQSFVIIGKIGSTYGIKGWLKVTAYTEELTQIFKYSPWFLEDHQTWKAIQVEDGKAYGKGLIAKIKGYDSPETARLLTGKTIAIKRDQLETLKKDEYYWSDLIGLEVINQNGQHLGKVTYILETGTHDVLVIKSDKEYGIPYLMNDVIKKIDLEAKEIHVCWDLI